MAKNWWEEERRKKEKYSAPSGSNVYVPCKYSRETLLCNDIRSNDVKKLRDRFYKFPEKQQQDSIVASLFVTKTATRSRPNDRNKNKSHFSGSKLSFSASYFITTRRV